ncbi:Fic family protein [Mesorhizobium australicum]|nr:Fic family protein [Mesorhizobium australicum]
MILRDDGETTGLFEPLMISADAKRRGVLNDLALDLAARSEGFRRSLPASISAALADLVRSMNCYYSNLIEGHNTHPIDIERALHGDYSADPEKRNLQLEAKAHITVQQWIDAGGLSEPATAPSAIQEMHRRFCELLPPELLVAKDPTTGEEVAVVPGALRERDVKVGRHIAVSPGAVPRFLARFHQAYSKLGRIDSVLAAACAHHRLLWVHPFVDGNGRVARMMSYAMLLGTLDTQGLWSVSRGLARQEKKYKYHLAACDMPRRNDLDGRGTLSEEELAAFAEFFLETCIDQISFMENLMRPDRLRDRILIWAEEQIRAGTLPSKSDIVLKAVLYQGELQRSDVVQMLGMSERAARRITSGLLDVGALTSESTRAPLRLAFPAKFADRWMPGLFPEDDGGR